MVGPETEKVHPLSFVLILTVTADLVVDDLSRLLAESDSVNVSK